MTLTDLMILHGIERIVLVPASDLLPRAAFHAWPFGEHLDCGVGATAEAAIHDAVARKLARAA